MSENIKTNYETIKDQLEAATKAYIRFSEILNYPAVIADRKTDKPKSVHLLKIVEEAYNSHLPVEILKLLLIINLPGANNFATRTTNLWVGNKHYEGYDVVPALKLLTKHSYQWEMALNAKVTNERLRQVIDNIKYYRNQIEKILGEIITFYHIL